MNQKAVVFSYTNNKQSEKKIKKVSTITLKKYIKCLGIHLTMGMKDLYPENYKTLLKKLEDINKWKDVLCSWIEKLNIV